MLFSKYLNSFSFYILIIFFLFSLSVNSINSFEIINSISYALLHFVLIYLCFYYYRTTLYLIYFFVGLGADLILIDNIGPHLLTFMFLLLTLNKARKLIQNFDSQNIYFIILFIQIALFFIEMIFAYFLFNIYINYIFFLKMTIISILISYTAFALFSKLDKFN